MQLEKQRTPAARDTSAMLVVWSSAPGDVLAPIRTALSFLAAEGSEAAQKPSIEDFFKQLNQSGARMRYCDSTPASIEDAIEQGVAQGCKQIIVVPVVLVMDAAPGALLNDIPARIAAINARHADTDIIYLGPPFERLHRISSLLTKAHEPTAVDLLKGAVARGFKGDWALFAGFMQRLQSALPPAARIALRGSVVTGQNYHTGMPFDANGPGTSDLDLVLFGDQAMAEWKAEAFYIPNVNTMPLSDKTPDIAPNLNPVRVELQQMVGRPVNIQAMQQWFLDLRSSLQGTPYVMLDS